ncbi:hypothetical protein EVAR_52815_1, partial [Eumeta japonica]
NRKAPKAALGSKRAARKDSPSFAGARKWITRRRHRFD